MLHFRIVPFLLGFCWIQVFNLGGGYKKCAHQLEIRVVRDWWRHLDEAPLCVKVSALGMWPAAMKKLGRDLHHGLVLDELRRLEFRARSQEKLPDTCSVRSMFADGYKKCALQLEIRVVRDWWIQLDEAPLCVQVGALGMWPAAMKKLDQDLHHGWFWMNCAPA